MAAPGEQNMGLLLAFTWADGRRRVPEEATGGGGNPQGQEDPDTVSLGCQVGGGRGETPKL